ncbi:putative DD41D transposase [Trichonephila clavipes]|uniref:Putative DD41D transposase n=1 Tax=Trichonephila clavipes TaxID=2585209 RepID=A0A8X6VD53_TRICX|nr:putative DD41D transposase [Trichonephila clavipes]
MMSGEQLDMDAGSFRSYYPYGLNVIWKGESVLLAFKQKSDDSLYIPNFDKSIDNSNTIRSARISRAKRRKRVTRDMSTLKNAMLELAVKFDDNYNTGLIKSFMFGMNKAEIKIMTDILSRYKFQDSHDGDRFNSCQVIYSQFGLAIHQNDHQARRRFGEWTQNEIAVVPDFHKRILFSDEAHFWLNGYVNKQNCRIWSEANPQVYVETPLHPEKLTVWCALWAGGIIGPYSFKNDEGHNVTVNGDRYRAMITNFFIPELNNHDVQELWFQQDGATCHTARATIDLLKDTFGDRLISRFGPVNWPPRSCDLTPLDYFLWGYVKSLVYADNPQTLDHLEDNIRRVIADIRPQMLEKVIENWTSRLDYIRASRGSPVPEIIFKM